jgi:hypothetical protein
MKKVLLAAMILLAGASFTSCSSSDDSSINDQKIQNDRENYLIGKWKVIGGGSGGGVYNPKIRIEGDCYLELMSSERTKCTGEATAYVYYAGEEPFMTKDVKEDLSFIKWSLQYEATGFTLYTYKSESSMPRTHDIDFESDGTIKLWFHTTYNSYYTLKKVK